MGKLLVLLSITTVITSGPASGFRHCTPTCADSIKHERQHQPVHRYLQNWRKNEEGLRPALQDCLLDLSPELVCHYLNKAASTRFEFMTTPSRLLEEPWIYA